MVAVHQPTTRSQHRGKALSQGRAPRRWGDLTEVALTALGEIISKNQGNISKSLFF